MVMQRWRARVHRFGRAAVVGTALGVGMLLIAGTAVAHAPSMSVVDGTPCTAAAAACVDMTAKRAWLIKDGQVLLGPVRIETGGPGKETPIGTFRVQWKNKDHISAEYGTPMPYAVLFVEGGIAFHQGTLRRQSAGCVRLSEADALAFHDVLQIGDEVQVQPGMTEPRA
jgi:hypothetical protein